MIGKRGLLLNLAMTNAEGQLNIYFQTCSKSDQIRNYSGRHIYNPRKKYKPFAFHAKIEPLKNKILTFPFSA